MEARVNASVEAEVIIVGAGPAGSSLAIRLARSGRDVLIVERSRFPRDKPCGDSVNPGALAELGRLGLKERLQRELRPKPLRGWRVEAPDGAAFAAEFGAREDGAAVEGWAVRRRDFDAALLDEALRAGARVRYGLRVFDLLRDGDRTSGVVVREGLAVHEMRASFVVGADGLRSVVQRRLALSSRPARLFKVALVGHLMGGNGVGAFGELRVRNGRTCGYASLRDGANVTLVIPRSEAVAMTGDARSVLLTMLSDFPEVEKRARLSGIEDSVMVTGPFDLPTRRAWGPGALLVGDAAGYYDPFTGQGVYQAMLSARLAADAIDEALLDDPSRERRALAAYNRRLRRTLAPTRALQRVIEAVVARPGLMPHFVKALSRDERGAARHLLRATGDLASPVTLVNPLLWLRLLGNMALKKT